MTNQERLCTIVRHIVGAVVAGLLTIGALTLVDRVKGPPQEPIVWSYASPRNVIAGRFIVVQYESVKHRDCPLSHFERRLWLTQDNVRTGDYFSLPIGTLVGTRGKADVGRDVEEVRILIPANVPPGEYEYQPIIKRVCIPVFGKEWDTGQSPARITVLPPA